MSYRLLVTCLLGIGVICALWFITGTVHIVRNAKPVTVYPVRMRFAGPHGVVKTCYIESDTSVTYGKLIAKRNYSGFSISKLLVPESGINRLRKATFYQYEDQVQFAATAGNSPAMIPRLYLDVLSYQMSRYLFLILGYVFLLIFSSELYKRLFGKAISEAEVTRLLNDTQLGKIYFYTWVGILVLIVIL